MRIHHAVLAIGAFVCVGCTDGDSSSSPSSGGDGGFDCGPKGELRWNEPGCDKPPSGCIVPGVPLEDTCFAMMDVCACDGTRIVFSCVGGGADRPFLPVGTGSCR